MIPVFSNAFAVFGRAPLREKGGIEAVGNRKLVEGFLDRLVQPAIVLGKSCDICMTCEAIFASRGAASEPLAPRLRHSLENARMDPVLVASAS
jgi:hypothetical protein